MPNGAFGSLEDEDSISCSTVPVQAVQVVQAVQAVGVQEGNGMPFGSSVHLGLVGETQLVASIEKPKFISETIHKAQQTSMIL